MKVNSLAVEYGQADTTLGLEKNHNVAINRRYQLFGHTVRLQQSRVAICSPHGGHGLIRYTSAPQLDLTLGNQCLMYAKYS